MLHRSQLPAIMSRAGRYEMCIHGLIVEFFLHLSRTSIKEKMLKESIFRLWLHSISRKHTIPRSRDVLVVTSISCAAFSKVKSISHVRFAR